MTPASSKRLRLLASAVSVILLVCLAVFAWFWSQLRYSLPLLDGEVAVAGLTAEVAIERDAEGVPTVRGPHRVDVAQALGFVHAQDRFFQMDLLRRRAAGEMAELFGPLALPADRRARPHGFREKARGVVERATPAERALIEAYATGVNAGLSALKSKPFEYWMLRVDPAPWRPEDCALMIYAMAFTLQDADGSHERSLTTLRDALGTVAANFFVPPMTPDDAALDGSTGPATEMPGPRLLDLRRRPAPAPQARGEAFEEPRGRAGSNSLAVAGALTGGRGAIVANDMHLELRLPAPWYRAVMIWQTPEGERRLAGVTLPGTPFLVAGSNGDIAWGFTNSYVDTTDLVVVEPNSIDPTLYAHGTALAEFEVRRDTLAVKGEEAVDIETTWTVWGPVVGKNANERPLALRWVMHEPEAANFRLSELETARTVDQAVTIAHRMGIPAQNIVIGDRAGQVAWTLAGRLPERFGFDGRWPVTWTYGDRGWRGLLPAEKMPVFRPADGRLWTANGRMLGDEPGRLMGDGGFDRPARAKQLRDGLARLPSPARPADLLALQLDDRALFLERWNRLLRDVLAGENAGPRNEYRTLAEAWEGRAQVNSVSYRLTRAFRDAVGRSVYGAIFAPCVEAFPAFDPSRFDLEPALWRMVTEKPEHLLPVEFSRWEDLLLAAVDQVVADCQREKLPLARATWGQRNTARIEHPLAQFLPELLAQHLRMPAEPLPGDHDMPRVQGPAFGASERFAVSPGREEEGIYHQPGGPSGHPLSPFFRAGHAAWVRGEPSPFLPGDTQHRLLLQPKTE